MGGLGVAARGAAGGGGGARGGSGRSSGRSQKQRGGGRYGRAASEEQSDETDFVFKAIFELDVADCAKQYLCEISATLRTNSPFRTYKHWCSSRPHHLVLKASRNILRKQQFWEP